MAAAMALMESPAIILAVLLGQPAASSVPCRPGWQTSCRRGTLKTVPARRRHLLHESPTDGAQLLLLWRDAGRHADRRQGEAVLALFPVDLSGGHAVFFLLDMGPTAPANWPQLAVPRPGCWSTPSLGPLLHASLALGLACCSGSSRATARC